jgi:hypothetical protein
MSSFAHALEELTPMELETAARFRLQGAPRVHWQCQIKACSNLITFRQSYSYTSPDRAATRSSKRVCDRHARQFADKHRLGQSETPDHETTNGGGGGNPR